MATPIPENRASFAIDEIVRATAGTLVQRGAANEIAGVVTDSRAVVPGALFVALRGETHDGHAFVAAAVERGASAVLVERGRGAETAQRSSSVSVVEVDDTLVAWGDLARVHLARWKAAAVGVTVARESRPVGRRVVAITGSAGKTTTKELTAALLGAVAATHATAGNLNNRVGVPSVVFALENDRTYCVLEMGMSLPGELDAITSFAPPDVSIVTNVGVAHAEGVGGREGVMREKGAVYRALSADGVAIVNADDDFAGRAAAGVKGRVITFGRARGADYRLLGRAPAGERGWLVTIAAQGREISVAIPLAGEAAAVDFAAALAAQEAASGVRLSPAELERAARGVKLVGRATLLTLPGGVLVLDDTYNANPASMRASLATLSEIAGERRKVAVLGEMKELGALTDAEHVALGDAVADAGFALVIGCGGKIDLTLDRAAARGVEVVVSASTEEASREAVGRIGSGDAVLAKGSRSVAVEKVVTALVARSADFAADPAPGSPESLPILGKSALSKPS